MNASSVQIQHAIKQAAEKQRMSLLEIQKASEWLLNPEIRKKYDAKLLSVYPELIEQWQQSEPPMKPKSAPRSASARARLPESIWKNKLAIVVAVLALLVGGYYVASPYWALRQLATAVEEGDVDKMSRYIDYPAVKDSVSNQLKAVLIQKMQTDNRMKDHPFAEGAMVFAMTMMDKMVDVLVSKEGMRALFNGDDRQQLEQQAQAEGKELRLRKAELDYQGLNKMHATITSKKGEQITFIFEREGFADWKMKSVELPLNNFDK